eukprot:351010-Chlamydomonas_euryale.AAC.1
MTAPLPPLAQELPLEGRRPTMTAPLPLCTSIHNLRCPVSVKLKGRHESRGAFAAPHHPCFKYDVRRCKRAAWTVTSGPRCMQPRAPPPSLPPRLIKYSKSQSQRERERMHEGYACIERSKTELCLVFDSLEGIKHLAGCNIPNMSSLPLLQCTARQHINTQPLNRPGPQPWRAKTPINRTLAVDGRTRAGCDQTLRQTQRLAGVLCRYELA